MSTESWSSRVRHDSDATFREWGSEFAAKLALVGLIQTADTGQINWTTVTRAGTNANAGYEIWRFNDTQQGTAPIYMRIDYGTGSNTSNPRIMITVGTGSNGSGTITGTALTSSTAVCRTNAGTSATDTSRQSYMCCVDGFFGFSWKVGSNAEGAFYLCRTVDSDGDPTATGAMVVWTSASTSQQQTTQALRFASTAVAYTSQSSLATAALCMNPQALAVSNVGADIQAYPAWTITPRTEPLVGLCGVIDSELSMGSTFSTTLVGAATRTYIALGTGAGNPSHIVSTSSGGLKFAMLWE